MVAALENECPRASAVGFAGRSPARAIVVALCVAAVSRHWAQAHEDLVVQYNRDIRPILSDNCFACHGFDKASREADLRLDEAESALADRGGYAAIVPHDAESSEVWRRIASDDEFEMMPPPDSHRALTPQQKETVRRWIEQGAAYQAHWSFIPPRKTPPPEVRNGAWPRGAIDRFVLAQLERQGLGPAPEADRRTLARRAALDLTGLPPSPEELAEFLADDRPDAYERLVDRLLASPHFGERLALVWLDAARYADTNGYSIDGGRHMWLWRDWVIDAANRNMTYDQFLIEQLAGDLLPEPSPAQLIATGFQRNNMVTHEGGTIPEENLVNYNADRVKTLGEAVLGLTLGCAQCHDHKYDPISQREYYQLFAYFNTLGDIGLDGNAGVNPRPSIQARTVLDTGEAPQLRARIAELQRQLAEVDGDAVDRWAARQRRRLHERGRSLSIHGVTPLKVSTPNAGSGFDIENRRYVRITKPQDLVAFDVSLEMPQIGHPIEAVRIAFYPADDAPGGGFGFGQLDPPPSQEGESDAAGPQTPGTFVVTAISVSAESAPGDQVNLHRLQEFRQVTASSWRTEFRPETVLDPRDDGWAPRPGDASPRLTLTLQTPIDPAEAPYMTVQVNFGRRGSLVGARFEIQALTGADDDSELDAELIPIVLKTPEQRDPPETARLRSYYAQHAADAAPLRIELANLQERLRVLTEEFPAMVMAESPSPRITHILNRGNYADPTEPVEAGVPQALPPLPEGAPANRLGLAQWVASDDHPLTARVAVNRLWQLAFGAGLVRTPADFGSQGEWPTHPELLDWLAVDFVEHGWDVKRLLRQIVTSGTYRQSSRTTDDLLRRDPDNRLLARGPRFRLPAELIRDNALAVSGLLIPRLGGPSVNPYAPGDLWREVSHYGSSPATAQTFVQDHGEKLYRRSLYTYWKRTAPPPNLTAFDAPNRETCVVDRASTNTPLQALVLLNDVQFVEAARRLAELVLRRDGDDRQRMQWAVERCLARPATDAELEVLLRALARERRRYAAADAAARAYLAAGESPRDTSIPPAEHAAWAQAVSLLLNLSEFVTRH